jgi:hypothetical protein
VEHPHPAAVVHVPGAGVDLQGARVGPGWDPDLDVGEFTADEQQVAVDPEPAAADDDRRGPSFRSGSARIGTRPGSRVTPADSSRRCRALSTSICATGPYTRFTGGPVWLC